MTWDFPGGPVVKNLPASVEDMGLIPGPGYPTCTGATGATRATKPASHNH